MKAQIATLESLSAAVAAATAERRTDLVERVYQLFAAGAEVFSEQHIQLFDQVFIRLVNAIEITVRASLADRLADMPQAPPAVSRILAFDDAIAVAGPVLERSVQLDSGALAENARTKSQPHLLAISKRLWLEECVTDILVRRGDRPVVLSTSRNSGARFSDFGYGTLVRRADGDDELAGIVGSRADLPRVHLLRLLGNASEVVRRKLEAADPLSSASIRTAIAATVSKIRAKAEGGARDYGAARTNVEAHRAAGKLDEAAVAALARAGRFEETAVALALLADLPLGVVEDAMRGERLDSLVIVAKAIGMTWPSVKVLLGVCAPNGNISDHQLDLCLGTFSRLKPATARQVLEFQRKRGGESGLGLPGKRFGNVTTT
jgi:uncharacterized protein (DUF2336 family)